MHSGAISIWFFIGVLLAVYGALIGGYGVAELATHPAAVELAAHPTADVLANLHAPLWWGGLLEALGLFYAIRFRPGRS